VDHLDKAQNMVMNKRSFPAAYKERPANTQNQKPIGGLSVGEPAAGVTMTEAPAT
jgi:hypothetical protein